LADIWTSDFIYLLVDSIVVVSYVDDTFSLNLGKLCMSICGATCFSHLLVDRCNEFM